MAGCGDVLSLEDLQTAKKHQIFEAEVITGKAGGVAGGATIGTATNPVTGQTQQTLPSILADLGFDVQSWTSSTGGVLASANQVFLNDTLGSLGLGDYYAWGGTFPKTVPAGTDPALPASGYIMRSSRFAGTQAREALRRICAEAGDNLVDGSFEAGGTLVNPNDVLLQERTGRAYSGPAGTVAAGTDPISGGFVDVSNVLNNSRNFRSFGVTGLGLADDTTALRAAIIWVGEARGRRVYGTPGDVYRITDELTVHWDGKFLDESSSCIIDFTGTTINVDADNVTALRIARNYVTVYKPTVDSFGLRSGVSAFALAPEDEAQSTQPVSQMFCELHSPVARNCDVGIRFRPGPTVSGLDSGSFYHSIYNPRFQNVHRGFYFARSVTGAILTTRVEVYSPVHHTGHCAWDIEAADSLTVFGGSAEFIMAEGMHAGTPTIKVHKPVPSDALSSSNIMFMRYYGEVGVTPFDLMPSESISMPGCTFFGYTNEGVNDTYLLQNMFQNEGPIVARAKYARNSTAALIARRDVGPNAGQTFLRYRDQASYPAEFYADRGFTFGSGIDVARIRDLQNTALNSQIIGSSLGRFDVSGSDTTGTVNFYNTSGLPGRAFEFDGVYSVGPASDNSVSAGRAAARYSIVYAATGTINTSDAREKTAPLPIDESVLDAWGDVQLVAFQWLNSIQEKGEASTRWHFGVIAQQVRDAFAARGLDGCNYGLLCYDEWDDEYRDIDVLDEEGNSVGMRKELVRTAGDRWGIRADQCLFLEAAYQRRRCDRIEARLSAAGL